MSEETDLARRASRGDVDAFCLLIATHRQALYRLAFRFCGNHHDAEDLLQDVFLNAYRAIGSFRGASTFKTWLRRIMVNSFLNHKRKTRVEDGEDVTESYGTSQGNTAHGPETAALNSVLLGRIFDRLSEIPARQRLMFLMKHQENLTSEEIAEHFGTSVGTVKKTVFRVVDQLRREFRAEEPGSLQQETRNA